jgi:nucleotide-binding universal stress UspA family protein
MKAEILVLGSRGLSGAAGYLAGSVASARAACPVVLVRPAPHPDTTADTPPTTSPGRVVLGIDLAHPYDEVIGFALETARRRRTSLHVLHAYSLPLAYSIASAQVVIPLQALAMERGAALAAALQPWQEKHPDVPFTSDAVLDRGADQLVKAAAGAALLVIGRRDRKSRLGAHLSHVAHSSSAFTADGPAARMTASQDPSAQQPIRVFLLDDHEVVRRGVHDLLDAESGIEVVGEAGTAEQALARGPAPRPDVAVLMYGCPTVTASRSAGSCGRGCPASPV